MGRGIREQGCYRRSGWKQDGKVRETTHPNAAVMRVNKGTGRSTHPKVRQWRTQGATEGKLDTNGEERDLGRWPEQTRWGVQGVETGVRNRSGTGPVASREMHMELRSRCWKKKKSEGVWCAKWWMCPTGHSVSRYPHCNEWTEVKRDADLWSAS